MAILFQFSPLLAVIWPFFGLSTKCLRIPAQPYAIHRGVWHMVVRGCTVHGAPLETMCKWFPGTNGSYVQMVPMYIWLPGTNGSHVQMVPMYK
jgi:hypothetical protein